MRWLVAAIFLLGWGCAFDFDGYDPRLLTVAAGGASAGGAASGGSAPGGAGGGGGASGGGGTTSAGGAEGGGGMGPTVVEIVAVIADCIDPIAPDPDACAADQPRATMGVDGEVTPGMMNERHSYLRFDLGEGLEGRVVSAVVEITVSTVSSAGSSSSGEIWQVAAFTRSDLFVSTPAPVGDAPIVGDQGAVGQGQTVSFALPVSVFAESSLFLGVLPLITDGIDYENLEGALPPRLVVTVE